VEMVVWSAAMAVMSRIEAGEMLTPRELVVMWWDAPESRMGRMHATLRALTWLKAPEAKYLVFCTHFAGRGRYSDLPFPMGSRVERKHSIGSLVKPRLCCGKSRAV
jgi:hypothetical protein